MNLSEALIGTAAIFSTISRGTTASHDQTFRREDGWRRGRQQGVPSVGALQVHVDTQLLLVLIEAHKRIDEGGTALVHPGGKQVGGADVGRQGLVVVELQLTRKPAGCQFTIIEKAVK